MQFAVVIILFITILLTIFIAYTTFSFLSAGPWVVVPKKDLTEALRHIGDGDGKTLIDLGSGDGTVVIAAAKKGFNALGIEINPTLYLFSLFKSRLLGVSKNAHFTIDNLWNVDISSYDVITCFLFPGVYERIKEKYKREARKGAILVLFEYGGGYEIIKK